MADALHGLGQLGISRNQPVENVFIDFQQVGVLDGPDRRGARVAAEQRHFSKRVPGTEHGDRIAGHSGVAGTIREDFHLAAPDDVEGVAGVTGPE